MRIRTFMVGGALAMSSAGIGGVFMACSQSNDSPTDAGTPDTWAFDGNTPYDGGDGDSGPRCTSTPCVVRIAAGGNHTCAALSDGTVRCWGLNVTGQLGQTIVADGGLERHSKPLVVADVADSVEVGAGGINIAYGFSCSRSSSGGVSCWGSNLLRQLGRDDAGPEPVPGQGAVEGVSQATQLATGGLHACVVAGDGGVVCWGSNLIGELGRPTTDGGQYLGAGPVEGLSGPASQTSAGVVFTCVLLRSGTVSCFGTNDSTQLGSADAGGQSYQPVLVPALSGVTELAAGVQHTCALVGATGVVVCWGNNATGQLGRGLGDTSQTPKRVDLPVERKAVHIGAGSGGNCAILDDDSVWCWGLNERGVGGSADAGLVLPVPSQIQGLPPGKMLQVAGGYQHMCVLVEGGSMWCWGSDRYGELGRSDDDPDGSASTQAHPIPAPVVF